MTAFLAMCVAICVIAITLSQTGEVAGALPEGPGLSAKYPGDAGIEKDPAVLLADSFTGNDLKTVLKRWQSTTEPKEQVLALSSEVPPGSADQQSMQMTVTWGKNTTGLLYTQLPRMVDTAYVRYYVKYDSKHFAYHCGSHIGGYNPPTPWAQGDPGRPNGDDWVQVEIMPSGRYGQAPPVWTIATFWPDMKVSARGQYCGNNINPASAAPLALDRWQCVEVMLKLNSAPEKDDGELALWLDGKLQMHVKKGTPREQWTGLGFNVAKEGGEPFEGFRWRTSDKLKINFLWLLYNIMQPNPDAPVSRTWFDNVVVSTEYIGPIVTKEK